MTHLDDDFIALTRKRVLDVSAILGMTVQVVFNGHKAPLFEHFGDCLSTACSVDWFVSLLVREEVLLAGLCERKILFRLEIYDRLRQATAKRTGYIKALFQALRRVCLF